MDVLIIQADCWRPCMETAGEIALQFKSMEKQVGFYYLDVNDPFEAPPLGIPPFQAKKIRKVRQLKKILEKSGVVCPDLSSRITNLSRACNEIDKITNVDELSEFSYDEMNLGLGVLSHIITILADPYPDLKLHAGLMKQGLLATIKAYEEAKLILRQCQPKQIMVYNGRVALSAAIVCAAKKENIPVKFFEHGNATIKKFFIREKDPFDFYHLSELIASLWEHAEKDKKRLAHDFFIRQKQGKQEIQNRNYASHQCVGKVHERHAKRITYFSSSDDELMSLSPTNLLGKSSIFSSQRDAVKFLINWAETTSDIELVVRVHPHLSKKSESEKKYWNGLFGKHVTLIESHSDIDSYALLESSDVVLTYGSTVGVEATYWGIPSISLCCAVYSSLSCVYQPTSMSELVRLLENTPPSLHQETCLPYAYFASNSETHTYQYYVPTSPSEGKLCGKELSMDLAIVNGIKKSFIGSFLKRTRVWLASKKVEFKQKTHA